MTTKSQRAPRFSDHVCVVTGSGGGIGRAIALAFAAEGSKVAILDKNETGANETRDLVIAAGGEGLALGCDTSDPDIVNAAKETISKHYGDVDILVNNAAIVYDGGLLDLSLADWNKVISVNVTGYFICSQTFGRPMCERRRGSLVHVASLAAKQAIPNLGSYGVSKAAAAMLSKLLAAEWGSMGVRSNCVNPGLIRTPMTQRSYDDPDILRRREQAVPLRRIGIPDDVAQAVLFLASPDAAYLNGAEIMVDGGFSDNFMSLLPRFG